MVMLAVLYVLISPLPEMASSYVYSSLLSFFALAGVVARLLRPAGSLSLCSGAAAFASPDTLLNKICTRLC